MDPFVPHFDIQKIKELSKEQDKSQKINVNSPRFISTLERALVKLFKDIDPEDTGLLTYKEFYNSFKNLAYDLSENDTRAMVALAEETEDSMQIPWQQFIPVGIEAIKTFISRNKSLAKKHALDRTVNKDTLRLIYRLEVKKIDEILQKRFKKIDYNEEKKEYSGKISYEDFSRIVKNTNWLTPKENNLILRQYFIKFGNDDGVEYKRFAEDLHKARYELAKSRIMDTSIDKVGPSLLEACKAVDEKCTGTISVQQLRVILLASNLIMLTPLQINFLCGYSNPEGADGLTVEYEPFCSGAKKLIEDNFTVDVLRRKAQLIQLGQFKEKEIEKYEIAELDLFKVFRDYDENRNCFLELYEYRECLE